MSSITYFLNQAAQALTQIRGVGILGLNYEPESGKMATAGQKRRLVRDLWWGKTPIEAWEDAQTKIVKVSNEAEIDRQVAAYRAQLEAGNTPP